MSDKDRAVEELRSALQAIHLNNSVIRSLRLRIGFSSSWEGRSLGRYLEKTSEGIHISDPFPADFVHGHLIEPSTNLFGGTSPMRTDFRNVVGLAFSIARRSWRFPEITHRNYFHAWATRIDGPVYVFLLDEGGPWARSLWIFSAENCRRERSIPGPCATLVPAMEI